MDLYLSDGVKFGAEFTIDTAALFLVYTDRGTRICWGFVTVGAGSGSL
jgi:hypothetical protein